MKSIEYASGGIGVYDDTLKEGDLITGYYSGYFELLKLEEREGNTPLAFMKMKYRSDGSPKESQKVYKCDSTFCRKANTRLELELANLEAEKRKLSAILTKYYP